MGLQFGLEKTDLCTKKSFRWVFEIPGVCADSSPGANALPPEKSARPNLSFKEMDVNHLIEDVFYPAKPDWKPITVVLYDLKRKTHPVFDWLLEIYDPQKGEFYEPNANNLIKECSLKMLDGCGEVIETWTYEDCWPQAVNFNNLEMGNSFIVMVELTLRYARAYIPRNIDEDS